MMFKDTLDGQTNYCEACEAEELTRAEIKGFNGEVLSFTTNIPHTCTPTDHSKSNYKRLEAMGAPEEYFGSIEIPKPDKLEQILNRIEVIEKRLELCASRLSVHISTDQGQGMIPLNETDSWKEAEHE